MKKYFLLLMVFTLALSSCKKYSIEKQNATDDALLQKFFTLNNLHPTKDPSGVYYEIVNPGVDAKPEASAYVSVKYIGSLLDGTVFDQSDSFVEKLTNLIQAWQIMVPKIAIGGEIRIYTPSSLAYGQAGLGTVPPNAPLYFDIKLLNFAN